ncbi:MAG: histidine phosphatase family protein [Flavobacteriales bacterium]|nr:histidine phosphatase family protein [Flavobacteriales bacterium]
MKKIIFIRHAKSDWGNQLSDIQRPIKKIGVEKTQKVALVLKDKIKFSIDAIFSSIAERAKSTAEIVLDILDLDTKLVLDENLYTFSVQELTNYIQKIPNQHQNVILFGHNEAFTDFVNKFGSEYIDNVPTSGCVLLSFEVDSWSKIEKGQTNWFITPKNII